MTAAGLATMTISSIPAAVTSTLGTSSPAAPCRSPYRPAHTRASVATTEWTSSPPVARPADACVAAAGRNVTTTPAVIAVEQNRIDGRTSAPSRSPASTPSG